MSSHDASREKGNSKLSTPWNNKDRHLEPRRRHDPNYKACVLFMKNAKEGARTTLFLATSPDVEGVSGKYFDNCKPTSSSQESYNKSLATRLWDLSVKMTHLLE